MVTAIIAAAGQGKRMGGGINKVFIPLFDCPILVHTTMKLARCKSIDRIIIAVSPEEVARTEKLLSGVALPKPWKVVAGGSERQHSIANALRVVEQNCKYVLVHDGARPLVSEDVAEAVIDAAVRYRAALVAVPVKDTVKFVDSNSYVVDTPERSRLWAVQTPQVFETGLLRAAYDKAEQEGYLGTDDASLVEKLGVRVKVIKGSYSNIKITTPEDLDIAKALLGQGCESDMMRCGIGYDVHRLVENRKLILGGVEVPHTYGLEGHSDADVLLHAIKDALLGAAGLGDIGGHFPDSDSRYKGISSLLLLKKVGELLEANEYVVNNIDATVVAQKPKLAPYISEMKVNIAQTLGINTDNVNVKATTTEGLGFAGRQEGIGAYAVATIIKKHKNNLT